MVCCEKKLLPIKEMLVSLGKCWCTGILLVCCSGAGERGVKSANLNSVCACMGHMAGALIPFLVL